MTEATSGKVSVVLQTNAPAVLVNELVLAANAVLQASGVLKWTIDHKEIA